MTVVRARRKRTIVAADLFAGAGGTSTGLAQACDAEGVKLRLTAVNHWPTAVETHAANHPAAAHVCETLDSVDPRKLFPGGLDVLCASPECTHHSNARGGKPCSDQSRATAWHVVRWAEALRPRAILVENVRELLTWGPLGANGRPLKSKRGAVFAAWVNALEALGYRVGYRLVNAADHGGATTRTRLFVLAVRGRAPIPWAEPTHERDPRPGLFGALAPWRAAREVIDWSLPGSSVFTRKRPLKENTVRRIAEGIRRFWGVDPEPFLVRLRGTSASHMPSSALSLSAPLPTLTGARHIGLCEPFVVGTGQPNARGPYVYPAGAPLPTITSADDHAVVFPATHHGDDRVRSATDPLPTVTGAHRGELALARPFIVPANFGERAGQSPRTHDIERPLPTIIGSGTHGLVQPFLVKFNGRSTVAPVSRPLDTITTLDRFGLVLPSGDEVVDVLFRMLQPHELAAGMGFPPGYVFKGNRGDVVKQIGNAVEVNVARAHLGELVRFVA